MSLTAESKSGSPITVTGTTDTSEKIVSFDSVSLVLHVYWYNPTTAGHLCSLKTKDGKQILLMRCEADAESQVWPVYAYYSDIYCDDLDSGTLYIYTT